MAVVETLELTSSAFEDGGEIPQEHTADGRNVSPPLAWGEAPEGTKCWAIVMDDPDAPKKDFCHWLVWDIPAETQRLHSDVGSKEKLFGGAVQGRNDFGDIGYGGPKPPAGERHRYRIRLFALDTKLKGISAGASREEVEDALTNNVIAEGELTGCYER